MVEMIKTLVKLIVILVFIALSLALLFIIIWPVFGSQIQLFLCSFTAYTRSTMSKILWNAMSLIIQVIIFVGMVVSLGPSFFSSLKNLLKEWKALQWESCVDVESFWQLAKEHASSWVRSGVWKSGIVKFVGKYGVVGVLIIMGTYFLYQALPLACPMTVDVYAGDKQKPMEENKFLDYVAQEGAITWNTFLSGRGDPLFFKKPNPWPLIVLHYHVNTPVTFRKIVEAIEKEAHVKYDRNFVIIYNNDIVPADKLTDYETKDGDIYFMFIDTYADGANILAGQNLIPSCDTPFMWFASKDTLLVCIVPE